jgi:hypothetical protein
MSIPLDRLYQYIENIASNIYGDSVIIYRFWPNGSKNIQDLHLLRTYSTWLELMTRPSVWCHDQEPLAHEFYRQQAQSLKTSKFVDLLKSLDLFSPPQNLNYIRNIFQKNILLHSEKRSKEIEKYQTDNELIPVYYWSHAVIARDWFRYAQQENFKKSTRKQFLIYNRAWTGTREYRLRFSDLLIEHDLADQCLTFCNPIEDGQHYQDHTFINPAWTPKHVLENYFQTSTADSSASADFSTEDYQSTNVEVVLETLFDDNRLHLTEKSLRPIACRQPFILMSTPGSLQYLRDYGFQTFDTVWNEGYDLIQDPYQRMRAIIDVMCDISSWSDARRHANQQRMEQIVHHNQTHFFSQDFSDRIINELQTNMLEAFNQIKSDPGFDQWIKRWQGFLQSPKIQEFMNCNEQDSFRPVTDPSKTQYKRILEFIEQYSLNQLQ